jgi:restriction endonuclease Mrr
MTWPERGSAVRVSRGWTVSLRYATYRHLGVANDSHYVFSFHFTPEAKKEATRDGAPPVDLIGGEQLCDLLKEYGLGVNAEPRIVYDITIDEGFFASV